MNKWKIVSQIAMGFGIVLFAFAMFAAFINFELESMQYANSALPAEFYPVNALGSMFVYLLFAAFSFVVALITWRSARFSEEMPLITSEPEGEKQT